MQSLKSERAKKEYEQFVKEVTPKQNLFCNMAKAFIVGGLICVVGQILLHIGKTQFSLSKDDAGSWCSLILILSSVILTGLNIYQKIVTFAGCGALVPITGFANSVAAPAIEYKKKDRSSASVRNFHHRRTCHSVRCLCKLAARLSLLAVDRCRELVLNQFRSASASSFVQPSRL